MPNRTPAVTPQCCQSVQRAGRHRIWAHSRSRRSEPIHFELKIRLRQFTVLIIVDGAGCVKRSEPAERDYHRGRRALRNKSAAVEGQSTWRPANAQ
jgi:hypothetical protein